MLPEGIFGVVASAAIRVAREVRPLVFFLQQLWLLLLRLSASGLDRDSAPERLLLHLRELWRSQLLRS